ncbi:MAG: TlpA family protein disulfide reductase [Chloroflexi bacterium]|nr:TlpA family protein disulfide reductase [Chloroflexota bacterium]
MTISILLVVSLAVAGCQSSPQSNEPGPTGSAPDFVLTDLDNHPVRLSDLRGHAVLLNFWATWCSPCRAEMPDLQAIHEEYGDDGLVILAANINEPKEGVQEFVTHYSLTFRILLDSSGQVARLYQVRGIPTTFFIDRDGIIRDRVVGGPMRREYIASKVRPLLNQ